MERYQYMKHVDISIYKTWRDINMSLSFYSNYKVEILNGLFASLTPNYD